MAHLREDIAKVIRRADSSYFFEDYTKQAQAVLRFLDKKGLMLVPKNATSDMLESGIDAIPSGRVRPEEVVESVYGAMIKLGAKTVLENKLDATPAKDTGKKSA